MQVGAVDGRALCSISLCPVLQCCMLGCRPHHEAVLLQCCRRARGEYSRRARARCTAAVPRAAANQTAGTAPGRGGKKEFGAPWLASTLAGPCTWRG